MEKVKEKSWPLVFETSWEVCNKVGGIYTVLSTKSPELQRLGKDRTIFIGPDIWNEEHPSPWFRPGRVPRWLSEIIKTIKLPYHITVRAGRWDIPGHPIALLVSFKEVFPELDMYYAKMWEWYKVDSLHAYGDYGEGCAFALAAAIVIQAISTKIKEKDPDEKIAAQFHEWTTGMGLLLLKHFDPEIKTVFTTHATSIGRSICGNGKPLYSELSHYNGDQMARELNMEAKHSLEKTAAREANVFTTVSRVTGTEAEQLLERKPDILTLNGTELDEKESARTCTAKRQLARETLLSLAAKMKGHNFTDDTFIVITGGRNEFRNKGLDMLLDAVNLCRQGAEKGKKRKMIVFVMVPSDSAEPISDEVLTHSLRHPEHDLIYSKIKQDHSETQVIYVPCYLNGDDGVLNLPYIDLLRGADLSVFPSYYEPWGYTPLESVSLGVPTITTSLSGFGQWVLESAPNSFLGSGVRVITRDDYNYSQAVRAIADTIDHLMETTPQQWLEASHAAQATARRASWHNFITFYKQAYDKSL